MLCVVCLRSCASPIGFVARPVAPLLGSARVRSRFLACSARCASARGRRRHTHNNNTSGGTILRGVIQCPWGFRGFLTNVSRRCRSVAVPCASRLCARPRPASRGNGLGACACAPCGCACRGGFLVSSRLCARPRPASRGNGLGACACAPRCCACLA